VNYPPVPSPAYPDWSQAYSFATSPWGGLGQGWSSGTGAGLGVGPGVLPGGGATSIGAFPRGTVDPRKAAVLGAGAWTFAPDGGIVLSQLVDDAMARMGPRVYELMLADDMVKSSIDTLKLGTLGGGVQAVSALQAKPGEKVEDPGRQRKIDLAARIAEECQRLTDRMPAFYDDLEEMLDGVVYGSSLAEKTWGKAADGIDRGKVILTSFVVKPRASWAFVVDSYLEVRGFWVWTLDGPVVVKPAKFATFTWCPRFGDPRGTSILRAAFDPWTFKMQGKPYRAKFLSLFSDPTVVCRYANKVGSQYVYPIGPDGLPDYSQMPLTPDQQAAAIAANIHSGSWAAIPDDWALDFLEPKVDGAAFDRNEDACNRAIGRVILLSAGTTMEAEHDSQSNREASQDVTDLRYGRAQQGLAAMIRRDRAAASPSRLVGSSRLASWDHPPGTGWPSASPPRPASAMALNSASPMSSNSLSTARRTAAWISTDAFRIMPASRNVHRGPSGWISRLPSAATISRTASTRSMSSALSLRASAFRKALSRQSWRRRSHLAASFAAARAMARSRTRSMFSSNNLVLWPQSQVRDQRYRMLGPR
jgi:hypothetical protein